MIRRCRAFQISEALGQRCSQRGSDPPVLSAAVVNIRQQAPRERWPTQSRANGPIFTMVISVSRSSAKNAWTNNAAIVESEGMPRSGGDGLAQLRAGSANDPKSCSRAKTVPQEMLAVALESRRSTASKGRTYLQVTNWLSRYRVCNVVLNRSLRIGVACTLPELLGSTSAFGSRPRSTKDIVDTGCFLQAVSRTSPPRSQRRIVQLKAQGLFNRVRCHREASRKLPAGTRWSHFLMPATKQKLTSIPRLSRGSGDVESRRCSSSSQARKKTLEPRQSRQKFKAKGSKVND